MIPILGFPFSVWGKTINDQSGRCIRVEKPFQRIITLYPAHAENLVFMGQKDKIIGVSGAERLNAPLDVPTFSYYDDAERFMAAKPDLVLIRPMIDLRHGQFVKKLEMAGIVVVSLQPLSMEDMFDYWEILGILAGCEDQATSMRERFQTAVTDIRAVSENIPEDRRRHVYFEAMHSRMKTFTPEAMAMFALETAGGLNVADDAPSRKNLNIAVYGKERIIAKADRIDVYLAQNGVMNPITVEEIAAEPGFQVIRAMKNKQIYLVDEILVSRPTPRLIEGILEIGHVLYPDIFTDAFKSKHLADIQLDD